jgi:hypothetical protein
VSRRPRPAPSARTPAGSATATLEPPERATLEPPERATLDGEPDAQAGPCRPFGDIGCGICPECRRREARLFDDLLAAHLAAIERAIHPDVTSN